MLLDLWVREVKVDAFFDGDLEHLVDCGIIVLVSVVVENSGKHPLKHSLLEVGEAGRFHSDGIATDSLRLLTAVPEAVGFFEEESQDIAVGRNRQ